MSLGAGLDVVFRGAIRLQRTQKNDGGWQWNNPNTNPSSGVPTPDNTLGVTGLGFLDAYRRQNSGPIFLSYNNLMAVCTPLYNRMVTNASNPSPSKHRIRGPDIRFLVRLAQLVADPTYSDFAKTRWQSAKTEFGGGTATGFAQYIRDARKSQNLLALISWDISLYVISLSVLNGAYPGEGFDVEAGDMVEVIYDSLYVPPLDFDMSNQSQTEYWLGVAGALDAFAITGHHNDLFTPLSDALNAGQQSDGRWIGVAGGSDVQTTSYAAVALTRAYRVSQAATYPYPPGWIPIEVQSALDYLAGKQLDNGGFEGDPGVENTEVTSEVLQTLCRIERYGNG
jgi:hypothetical protein